MPDVSMTAVTAALSQQKAASTTSGAATKVYPFYLLTAGLTCLVRFLPDKDSDEMTLPWAESHTIRLPFAGIIHSDADTYEDVTSTVPSWTMFGKKDRIQEHIKPLWESDRDLARTYYRKVYYLMSGLVNSSPIVERMEPESPIRLFRFGKQLHGVIEAGLLNAGFDYAPWSYQHGRDFAIVKTMQGNFANYGTSNWKFKERPLNAEELAAIDKYGLIDLQEQVGIEPDKDVQEMVFEMYQASRANQPFDNAKWGSHFKAYTSQFGGTGNGASHTPAVTPPSQEDRDASNAALAALKRRNSSTTIGK